MINEKPTAPDLLEAILGATRCSIKERKREVSLSDLEQRVDGRLGDGDQFVRVLRQNDRYNVIAECKRRSPSRGLICSSYEPVNIACGYVQAGAAAISVLTEPSFFDGSLDHLASVRAAVDLPLLRKDFIISDYQILEAVLVGADAVLLIVSALDNETLVHLVTYARKFGLEPLLEVHNRAELIRALDAGAAVIGVNNRNLRTLDVDLGASEDLIGHIPEEVVAIAESGLNGSEDLTRLRSVGYNGFLIGEALMSKPVPGDTLKKLLGPLDPRSVDRAIRPVDVDERRRES